MIDPQNITDYNRTKPQLEEFLLFCVVVAGKTAQTQSKFLEDFLKLEPAATPFEAIRQMIAKGTLEENLRTARLGQYGKIARAFTQLAEGALDLTTCSVNDLEGVHGVGPKTSRFFVVHSRLNQQHAILDTHILKYLRETLHLPAPLSTPSSQGLYSKLEQEFIAHCSRVGKSTAELDLEIWRSYSRTSRDTTVAAVAA